MKTKILLTMTMLLLGLLPGRAKSHITVDGLLYEIENGEAALIGGPVWRNDESGEEFDPVSKVVIPEKVVGCDVTAIYFNPYCDTLVIPKTVKTIDVKMYLMSLDEEHFDNPNWGEEDMYGAKFVESKVENPAGTFRLGGLFYAVMIGWAWEDGTSHSWLKVPKGCESNYDNFLPVGSYPVMVYSEEIEDQGIIYRVKWSDKTAIIAGYTSDFPTGADVSYTIPQGFTDASGNYFTVVGVDVSPNVGTLFLPLDSSHKMKFLRNLPESLTKLIIPEGLQNLYIDWDYQINYKFETFVCESGLRLGPASIINAEKIYYYGTYDDFDLTGEHSGITPDILYVPSSEVTKFQSAFEDLAVRPLPDDYAGIENWTCPGLKFRLYEPDPTSGDFDDYGMRAYVSGYTADLPEHVVIPETYNGYDVMGIDARVFKNCTTIKSVTLPDKLGRIGEEAFMGCTNLESVYTVERKWSEYSIRSARKSAFEGCTALKEICNKVSDDDYVRPKFSVYDHAFYGTTSLQNFPEIFENVGDYAFYQSGIKSFGVLTEADFAYLNIGTHAFEGSKVERVSINFDGYIEPRLILGEGAFYNCGCLMEFEYIGPNLTIGKQAFHGCSAFKKFSITDPVWRIGDQAFLGCSALETLNLCPKYEEGTFTELGEQVFSYCMNLKSLILPYCARITKESTLGLWLQSLEQLTMPWYLHKNPGVPDNAFNGTQIPTNYKIVSFNPAPFSDGAFPSDTYQNATVKVPSGQIPTYQATEGWRNFVNFQEISDDDYNKVVINDVEYSLNQSTSTATVTGYQQEMVGILVEQIPIWGQRPVYEIQPISFDQDGNPVEYGPVLVGYEEAITGYTEQESPIYNTHEALTLENSITWGGTTYTVNKIADEAFKDCQMLKKLTIPSSYTSIGKNVFTGSSLEEVVLNCPLQANSEWSYTAETPTCPFYGAEKLVKATVGEGTCTTLPYTLFGGASALKEVTLPSNLREIYAYAFAGTGLETIQLPTSVTHLLKGVFMDSKLKSITLHEGMYVVSNSCFSGTPIEELYLPSTLNYSYTTLYQTALKDIVSGMDSLRKVVCAENQTLTKVPQSTFTNMDKLEEIVLPSTVKTIESYAFKGCVSLKNVVLSEGLQTIKGNAFYGCTSLQSLELPEGLETIGPQAFLGCTSLEEANLPSTVKTIGGYAFYKTKLKALTLPESLESVGIYAFWQNQNPSNGYYQNFPYVVTYATTPPSRSDYKLIKNGNGPNIPPLYVLVGCKAAYEEAWGDEFTDIREFPGTELVVYGEEKTSPRGATVEVPVELFNITEAAGVMFDVTLPEGVSLVKTTSGKYDVTLSGRTTDHQLIVTDLPNGDYRIIVVSLSSQPITGNDGTLLKMGLDVSTTAQSGDFEIVFHDTEVVTQSGTSLSSVLAADGSMPFTVLPLLVGDIDGNNRIQLLDVLTLLAHINNIQPIDFTTVNKQVADVVADDVINLLDALQLIYILSKQTTGTNAPSAPADGMVTVAPGEGGLDVSVSAEPFTALTMDVTLPSGFCVDGVTLDSSRCADHSVRLTDLGGGRYRVIVFSTGLSPVQGESGRLMHISTSVTPTDVSIGDIEIGTCDLRQLSLSPVEGYTTGMGRLAGGLSVRSDGSSLVVTSDRNAVLSVVGTDGRLVRNLEVGPGTSRHGGFAPGVYVVNGARVIIR